MIRRLFFLALGALVGLLTLGLVAGAVLTLSVPGRTVLAGLINSSASGEDFAIDVRDLDGLVTGALRIGAVTVSDREGPWVSIEQIELDWSPFELLAGTFLGDRLEVGRVRLLRFPLPALTPSERSAGLPLSIVLRDFAIHRIEIPRAMAGADFDLRTVGRASVRMNPMHVAMDVEVARDDDIAGSGHVKVDFAPDDNLLNLDVAVREPSGGALAGLLRFPGNPSVDFSLTGAGPLQDWSADLAFDLDDKRILGGTAAIHGTGADLAAKLDVVAEIAALLPDPYGAMFAGTTRVALDARRSSDGGVHIAQAFVKSEMVSMDVLGDLDPTGGLVDLTGQLSIAAKAGWVSFGTANADLAVLAPRAAFRASGGMQDTAWEVSGDLDGFRSAHGSSGRVSVKGAGKGADLAALRIPYTLEAIVADWAMPQAQVALLLDGRIGLKTTGRIDGDMVRVDAVDLQASGLTATGSAGFDRAAASLEGELEANVRWPLDPEAFPGLADDRIALAMGFARNDEGIVEIRSAKLSSKALTVDLRATVGGEKISATGSARLSDLSLLSADMGGAVGLDLTARGALAAPELVITAKGADMRVRGEPLQAPTLTVKGVASALAPSGILELSAGFAGTKLTGSGSLSTDENGARRIEKLLFTYAGAELSGGIVLGPNGVPVGRLALSAPDLSRIASLFPAEMSGSVVADAELSDDNGALKVVASATVPAFANKAVSVSDAKLSATLVDTLGGLQARGQVTARALSAGGTVIADIVVNAGPPEKPALAPPGTTEFDIRANAAGIPAQVRGQVEIAGRRVAVRLNDAKAKYRNLAPYLASPAEILIEDGVVTIGRTEVEIGGGKLILAGSVGNKLAVEASLVGIPMTTIDEFAPGLGAGGSLSGNVTVRGTTADPDIGYDLAWSKAAFLATRVAGIPPLALSANGRFKQGGTTVFARADGYPGLEITAEGAVSLTGDRPMKITLNGAVPFSLLDRQLAAQGRRLTGAGTLRAEISGSARHPVVNGVVTMSGATFVDSTVSLVVRDMDLKAVLTRDRITIEALKGALSGGGTLSASGTIETGSSGLLPTDLALQIRDGRYTDGQLVSTEFNADLSVKGELLGLSTIGGSIVLDRVDITVPEKLPRSIASLSVQHRNAPAAIVRQAEAISPGRAGYDEAGDAPDMRLDIDIKAARQIFLRGRGIDAELGGSLKLKGPAAAPVAVGRFAMRRGRLSILSQRFDFSRGAVGFSGSLSPALDFSAGTLVAGTTVTVDVTGQASNPVIALSSNPDLPDEEILALLLFNRGLADMTAIQAAQLANAVATLGGIGGSYGVVDRVRDSLGLSDIDIKSDSAGKTSVSVGRRIGDKVYLGVEQGIGKGSSRVKIELDIAKGLKARGEVGADGKSKGGVFFERNY